MRESIIETVRNKQRVFERTEQEIQTLEINIQRKRRIIVDAELKIVQTKEGIEHKLLAIDEVKARQAVLRKVLDRMNELAARYEANAERLEQIYRQLVVIEEPIDRAVEENPMTAPKRADNPEWVKLNAEAVRLRLENNETLPEIKRLYQGKVVL